METPTQRLRALLDQPGLRIMPCCFDALSARLIERAGFELTFMSGFAVAAARIGGPDTGLISYGEMVDQGRDICSAVAIPVIGDADTGYGNPLNVKRTVTGYARAGFACAMIEDQRAPKRCGHTRGKEVVPRTEALDRIRAAVEAREEGADILIMARTDARAGHGLDEALDRARAFAELGADLLFVEAPQSEAEMARICDEAPGVHMANLVGGGDSPILPPRRLAELGYKIAAYPLALLTAAVDGMQRALDALHRGELAEGGLDFAALREIVGFDAYDAALARFGGDPEAGDGAGMGEAVFAHAIGGPEVLRLEPHDPGEPGPGAVRIRVAAAGVNFIDVYFRTGVYPRPLPFVCGLEGAGVVEAVGPEVADLAPGDRVAWAAVPGSYATHLIAPADRVVPVPAGIDDAVAAAAMLQGMTAHYLTHGCREPRPGDLALVHAAAGGTGALLVQLLHRAGVRVIGTCSTEAKAALARKAGAEHVVRYTEEDFAEAVGRITEGRGVDVVYDSVGRTTFEGSLASLRPRGLLVLFGQSSGVVPPFDLNRLNTGGSLFVTRPSLAHYTADRDELVQRAGAVLGAVADGSLEIRIGEEFPLARAADAQRALESRSTAGKLLLRA